MGTLSKSRDSEKTLPLPERQKYFSGIQPRRHTGASATRISYAFNDLTGTTIKKGEIVSGLPTAQELAVT
jgi:hypothetical protein